MSELEGKIAYEADRAARPNYHDGKPRPTWENLSAIGKLSWSKPAREPKDAN